MQEHLCKPFESECHSGFRDDVSIILTDKTDGSNATKGEIYSMRTLKSIATYRMNVENGV